MLGETDRRAGWENMRMASRGPKTLSRRKNVNEDWFRLGQAVRRHRMRKGMTMEALAKAVNTGRSTIAKLEAGERKLHADWLMRISEALGMTVDELIRLDDRPISEQGGAPRPVHLVEVPVVDIARLETEPLDEVIAGSSESIVIRWPRDSLIAVRLKDAAMDRIAPPGALVVVDYGRKSLIDNHVILARAGDQIVLRRVRMTEGPFRLEPASNDLSFHTIYPTSFEMIGEAVEARYPFTYGSNAATCPGPAPSQPQA
ncbi:MAG: helix-turn-helix transcriptional regulator [Rhodospirillales bacterium]|nr:helix-turn-helix transcriptional regulator [Rhodospirillales bacterium]